MAAAVHADDDGVRVTAGVPTAIVSAVGSVRVAALFLLRHPGAWLIAYAMSIAIALPATAVMASRLLMAADGYPSPLGRGAIDVDWWLRLRQDDTWPAAEFGPRTLGFAAVLDTVGAVLDGPAAHAWPVVMTAAAHMVGWALLWPVTFTRAAGVRAGGIADGWSAIRRFSVPMLGVSVAAAMTMLLVSMALRPLFDGIFAAVASSNDARQTFLIRGVLLAAFGGVLLAIGVMADLARAHLVLVRGRRHAAIAAGALQLLRRHAMPLMLVCALVIVLHLAVIAGYGVGEVAGGARVGGWRAVAAAQLYVALRVGLRLFMGVAIFAVAQQDSRAASH